MANKKGWVFVTGTSTGIGLDLTRALSVEGFRVLAGVRTPDDFEKLRKMGPSVCPIIVDVTNPRHIKDAAERLNKETSPELPLIAVVNNAGVVFAGPMEIVSLENFRKQFDVNVWGGLAVIKETLPLLRRDNGGIINMGSLTGFIPIPYLGAYSMSKHALHAMSAVLNFELAELGVRATCLEPGSVRSAIWDKSGDIALRAMNESPSAQQADYAGFRSIMAHTLTRQKQAAIPADRISRFVINLLEKRQWRPYYRIGIQSKSLAVLHRILPVAWLQKILRKSIIGS